jgi:hypothetical protein
MRASIVLFFGDKERNFHLKMKQIEALQGICKAGIGVIAERLFHGQFTFADVRETIRLGLIGGGATPVEASEVCNLYVDSGPLASPNDPASPVQTAIAVMSAVYFGVAEAQADMPGKSQAGATNTDSQPEMTKPSESTSRPIEPSSSETESPQAA